MATAFIADLHLDESTPAVNQLAEKWFAGAAQFDVLWILGDLFDVWIGDDRPFGALRAAMVALTSLKDAGTAVHLMHGNRDFLLGDHFAAHTGVTIHTDDALVIDLNTGLPEHPDAADPAARCLLMHGDTLCTEDTDYLELRNTLRDPQWQAEFLARPLEQRAAISQQLRAGSRAATGDKSSAIMDVTPTAVADIMRATQVNTLLHGHTHRPADHRPACPESEAAARRVVLGDWHDDGAEVAVYDADAGLRLEHFS